MFHGLASSKSPLSSQHFSVQYTPCIPIQSCSNSVHVVTDNHMITLASKKHFG